MSLRTDKLVDLLRRARGGVNALAALSRLMDENVAINTAYWDGLVDEIDATLKDYR